MESISLLMSAFSKNVNLLSFDVDDSQESLIKYIQQNGLFISVNNIFFLIVIQQI